ncbi:MAG TPA: chemotaxis protein CheD [Myxococcaceae bacterium]|nr:chemotaxis protein CheD [Myxococcaceae bacterium]
MANRLPPDARRRPRVAAARQRLDSCTRPAQVLEAVGEIVSQLVGCEEFALLGLGVSGKAFASASAMGLDWERLQALLKAPGVLGRVARGEGAYVAGTTPGVSLSEAEEGLTACVPLRAGERVSGVLALFRLLPQKRGLDDEDLELLDLLSVHGGVGFTSGGAGIALAPAAPSPAAPEPAHTGLRTAYLHPGEIFTSATPTEVTTILGSCVAVCLWDSQLRMGGVNHFLLPSPPSAEQPSARYGDTAIPRLLEQLEALGSQRRNLRAKLFGGASVGPGARLSGRVQLGERNGELARRMLAELGISVIAEDLGGTSGRKLRFRTDDGTALIKKLGGG